MKEMEQNGKLLVEVWDGALETVHQIGLACYAKGFVAYQRAEPMGGSNLTSLGSVWVEKKDLPIWEQHKKDIMTAAYRRG